MTRFRCRKRRGCAGKQAKKRRDIAHAIEHQKLQADLERVYDAALLSETAAAAAAAALAEAEAEAAEAEAAEAETEARGAKTSLRAYSTPPRSAVPPASASPPAPSLPAAGRAVRRLELLIENTSALESTQPVDEGDAASLSSPESPNSCCSQRRLQEYLEQIKSSRYPTPPDAPREDQYISESEAGSPLRRPPAKIFRKGKLMYHKTFKGAEPIAYVDTGLYEGGHNDYYEAFNPSDLHWVRRIHYLLRAHKIPRWDVT